MHRALLEALRSLHRRSLVERDSLYPQMNPDGEAVFSLQNVVLEYSTEQLREFIIDQTPIEAHVILLAGVDQAISSASTQLASFTALIAILLALWGGMAGTSALIEATNRAYGIRNTRNIFMKRAMALGMTLLFTAMIVLTVAASFFNGRIVRQLISWFGHVQFLQDFGRLTQLVLSIAIARMDAAEARRREMFRGRSCWAQDPGVDPAPVRR